LRAVFASRASFGSLCLGGQMAVPPFFGSPSMADLLLVKWRLGPFDIPSSAENRPPRQLSANSFPSRGFEIEIFRFSRDGPQLAAEEKVKQSGRTLRCPEPRGRGIMNKQFVCRSTGPKPLPAILLENDREPGPAVQVGRERMAPIPAAVGVFRERSSASS